MAWRLTSLRQRQPRAGALLACLIGASTIASPVRGQTGVGSLSADATISVLTILPGNEIYSMFGHTAFRVRDPEQEIDQTYNYGTFAFENPIVFGAQFAYGDLEYLLSDSDFPRMFAFYRDVARRPIIEQVLRLTSTDQQRLFTFLEWNALPENRAYRYDFLFDNCSTRVRDALDEHVPSVRFEPATPGPTFRRMLDPYAADRTFLDFGWDLLLGQSVDRLATSWERMFLPIDLMHALDSATIAGPDGEAPLVVETDTLFWIEGATLSAASPPWPSIVLWAAFGSGLGLALAQRRGGAWPVARLFDAALLILAGFAGVMMALMWFVSLHDVTNANWNLLWAWPTHLVAGILVLRRNGIARLRPYFIATTIVTTLVILGWPVWPQELPLATIPLILLLALRSAWNAFGTDGLPARRSPSKAN